MSKSDGVIEIVFIVACVLSLIVMPVLVMLVFEFALVVFGLIAAGILPHNYMGFDTKSSVLDVVILGLLSTMMASAIVTYCVSVVQYFVVNKPMDRTLMGRLFHVKPKKEV